MTRSLVTVALLIASTVLATPSGKTWPLNTCSTSCTSPTSGQTTNNAICVTGRCLPEVRFAASVNNTGGMTLTGSQAVPYATVLVGMQSGFNRWTSAQVTSCGTSLNFSFQGTFTSPTLTAAVNGGDGNNNVIFLTNPNWRYGSGTLGLTGTRFFTTGELTDADMEMNGNTAWANDGRTSAWDYESVIAHEAGHFVGFDHTTSGNAVMNPSVANGTIKRALLAPDLSDVCTAYPGTNGGQGSSCTTMAMCTGGRVCEGPTGSTSRICTQDCTAVGQTCPAGYSCQASTAGFACLPQVGASDLCRFCTRGSDCSTGTCLTDGMGQNWCSVSCNPSTPNSCGPGYNCATFSSGNAFCEPATACTTQCTPATVATDCAPGYACTGGTCTPTGNPGDRCDASEFCLQCGLCIIDDVDPNLSYCRSCCNGQGECMGCSATTCQPVMGSPASCLPLSGSPEQVCIPTSGAALCTACNAGTPCQAGLICAAGVCRSPCNPSNPGACPACIGLSSGGGVCACGAGEVSDEGQSCTNTVPLRICRTGLRCVSGSCRTSCNPSAPTPCSSGFTCTSVSGLFFCLPGSPDAGSGAGGGGAGTGGGTAGGSATGGGRAGGTAGGVAGGTAGGMSAGGTAGGAPAGGTAAGGTAGGGAAAGGTAGGGSSGVGGGSAGGVSGTGGSGAGGPGLTCSSSTCNGCCSAGICVSFPSTDRCGANGSECRACSSTQTCNAGACVERPPPSCLSCSTAGWQPLVLAALAFFARRKR